MLVEEEGFPRPEAMVLFDILMATFPWLGAFDLVESDADVVLELGKYANEHNASLPEAAIALDVELGARVIATTLFMNLRNWDRGGRAQMPALLEYLEFGALHLDEEDSATDRAMVRLIRFLARLASVEEDPERNVDELRALLAEVEALGDAYEAMGKFDCAARCFDVGMNLVGLARAPEYRRCAERARRHVRRIDDAQLIASILMKNAIAAVVAAELDASLALKAYDAVYDAVIALDGQKLIRAQSKDFFMACFAQLRYRPLSLFYNLGDPDLDRAALPPELASMKVMPPTSELPFPNWVHAIMSIRLLFAETENGRLLLEPKAADTAVAETDWTTWEVSHPAYYRAIPHGSSFLRASGNENLMLVLSHELTHIMSMNGHVGLTILALKASAFALVLEIYKKAEVDVGNQEFLNALPSFDAPRIADLGTIERTLHIFRKLQIFKAVWSPWFEGIAVYTELADPAKDPEGAGPAMAMLHELVDRGRKEFGDTPEAVERMVLKLIADMEKRYGDALKTQAPFRLTEYLVTRHEGYLAGYLAVRSVVAAWRETLGTPLTAPIAARVLLHLTRGSTRVAIPDLSLPVEEFEQAARDMHLDWLQGLVRISAKTLVTAQIPYGRDMPFRAMRWTDGELELLDAEQANQAGLDSMERALNDAVKAWRTGCGALPAARSPTDQSAVARQAYLEGLAERAPRMDLMKILMGRMAAPLAVLPFADVEARFFLNIPEKALFLILRTSEGEAGSASYDGLAIATTAESFDELLAQVRERGEFRMRVTRVIDTIPAGAIAERTAGRHALVLQYGSWMHIQMSGSLLGISNIEPSLKSDIRSRLEPDPIDRFNREVMTDGRPLAQAILKRIEGRRPLHLELGGHEVDVTAWGMAVEAAAADVISASDTETRTRVRRALLTRAVGLPEERAEKMLASGLRALSPFGASHPVGDIVQLLVDSAQEPASSGELWAEAEELFRRSPLGVDVRPAFPGA